MAEADFPATDIHGRAAPDRDTGRAEHPDASVARTKAEPALLEAVLDRSNMRRAYERVVSNKGAAGVDGLGVSELGDLLRQHWPTIKAKLLDGSYRPQPVRQVSVPKPNGGERKLGIPTVLDRLIQQALHQVLSPIFEPTFSEYSYGFRPGRNAHQAVQAARLQVLGGHGWVVDLDLESFFDRVNHDLLMERVGREVKDRRVLKLIRRYLKAGLMVDGLHAPRREGTPQGGPLSPLLSNVLLTELDRELERRGHRFVRYADDVVIHVRSERAGHRVLDSVTRYVGSATETARQRGEERRGATGATFLPGLPDRPPEAYCASRGGSRVRLTAKLRQLLRGARGRSLGQAIETLNPVLRGWAAYYKLAHSTTALESMDGWVRRKLRVYPVAAVETASHPRTLPASAGAFCGAGMEIVG